MASFKVIALDCDGVMFDSEKANTAYYNRVLNHFGRPGLLPEQLDYVHMHTAGEALALLFPDDNMLRQALAFCRETGYTDFIRLMEIEPHLRDLLNKVRPHMKTAVATNRTNTMGQVIREHGLEGMFDLVVCALDVDKPKPHPDMLKKVSNHFGVPSYEVLFIGDSELDSQAAYAANVPFAAYANPSLEANFHISSLQEVGVILEGYSRFDGF
ncbi:MAG: HAD family hydrolase [Desulfobacterales bacterium]|jgi:HAD superfamily hydrolase (TIGR01549 family)|nr:HAD family hydrolase [Desulfobacterales bacterium]